MSNSARSGAEAESDETHPWMRLVVGLRARWALSTALYCPVEAQKAGQKIAPATAVGSGSGRAELELSLSRLGKPGLQFEQAVAPQAEP